MHHTLEYVSSLHHVRTLRPVFGESKLPIVNLIAANGSKRPSQVRAYLENENMPVFEAPEDDGDHAPRQSYNFAPGYHGIVYRADTPDWGAGPRSHKKGEGEPEEEATPDVQLETEQSEVRYKLQSNEAKEALYRHCTGLLRVVEERQGQSASLCEAER
jgi:hypothetical protein